MLIIFNFLLLCSDLCDFKGCLLQDAAFDISKSTDNAAASRTWSAFFTTCPLYFSKSVFHLLDLQSGSGLTLGLPCAV